MGWDEQDDMILDGMGWDEQDDMILMEWDGMG